jgi:hypothetical protein
MKIAVTVTRGALTIKDCPAELADALTFVRNRVSFGNGELEHVPERVSYAQFDAQTKLCRTYPNALHLVQAAAQQLGVTVEIHDQRLRPRLDFRCIDRKDYPSDVCQLLETVAQGARSGIVLVPMECDRAAIVCGLARLLPQHFKILITGDDQIFAFRFHESLARIMADEKIGLHADHRSTRSRIMVTHFDGLPDFARGDLAYSGYALRDFDAWICDDAHRIPEPERLALLSQFRAVYSWGLTATPVRADNSHQLLPVIFGPVLYPDGREAIAFQAANGQPNVSTRVFVFPLPAPSLAANLRVHEKLRIAYLKNPTLAATLRGIDASLPQKAKVLVLTDSLRLGIILQRQLPHYVWLDGRESVERRQTALDRLRNGEIHRIMVCAGQIDLPQVDYLIDSTFAANLIGGGGRRPLEDEGRHSNYIMLLCLASEEFFNDGIAKLQKMNALEWQVAYMFERSLVENLPFAHAPLLPELGTFPER